MATPVTEISVAIPYVICSMISIASNSLASCYLICPFSQQSNVPRIDWHGGHIDDKLLREEAYFLESLQVS